MQIAEFREQIKPGVKLQVKNETFIVKEVVKFRFDNGSFYIKCFLNDGFVFADDLERNMFLLVKEIKTAIKEPFPPEIDFAGKKFKFLCADYAVAEETQGEEIFQKGQSETFWDYQATDDAYLSLGIIEETKEQLDFLGKIILPNEIKIEEI